MEWVMFRGTKPSEMIKALLGTESQDKDRLDSREFHVPRSRALKSSDGRLGAALQACPGQVSTEKCHNSWQLETPSPAAAMGPPSRKDKGRGQPYQYALPPSHPGTTTNPKHWFPSELLFMAKLQRAAAVNATKIGWLFFL